MRKNEELREIVKKKYGEIARGESSCCSPTKTSCCEGTSAEVVDLSHGYDQKELSSIPGGASLGLGCGNPLTLIELQPGWKILDLGSGAGIDVFLAAKRVGKHGHVTGLDMTDEMLGKARANAQRGGYTNVTFTKGDIEAMPFANDSFDLVISNCVINLVPDKQQAYREIYRVLKPGGRFAIQDMATRGKLPDNVRRSAESWAGCIAGALDLDEYLRIVRNVGFLGVEAKQINEYDFARTEEYAILSVGLVGGK